MQFNGRLLSLTGCVFAGALFAYHTLMISFRHKVMRQRMSKFTRNNPEIADAMERNIETILDLRREAKRARSFQDRMADYVTDFAGSMAFLYLHMLWFGIWIPVNLGWFPGLPAFDKFPFGLLTMIVSLEAIFLSTLVMISQNRSAEEADERADLDLQIDMLGEYEITRILKIVTAIGQKLNIEGCDDEELSQLEKTVLPAEVLKEIQERKKQLSDQA